MIKKNKNRKGQKCPQGHTRVNATLRIFSTAGFSIHNHKQMIKLMFTLVFSGEMELDILKAL